MLVYSKLNSKPYHHKLKFPSTSKQKFNSKPFESSKKRPNLDQKTLPKSNNHEKNQQKWRKDKRRQPSKTKNQKERKRRKRFWKVAFFFLSSFFVGFSHDLLIWVMFFGPNLVVFLRIRKFLNSWDFECLLLSVFQDGTFDPYYYRNLVEGCRVCWNKIWIRHLSKFTCKRKRRNVQAARERWRSDGEYS